MCSENESGFVPTSYHLIAISPLSWITKGRGKVEFIPEIPS